jgi:NAD-dependent deacetylase
MTLTTSMQLARRAIGEAKHLVVFSGAGISAASGVPTFRGAAGLWRNFEPTELATPQAFARQPAAVWAWYAWRRNLVSACEPNAAHIAITRWQAAGHRTTIVTQNVDGLHQRTGAHSVHTLHGSLFATRCADCFTTRDETHTWLSEGSRHWPPDIGTPACTTPDPPPPACAKCGGPERPGVVWFGEMLPEAEWEASETAIRNCDVVLVVGTSASVYPAAGLVEIGRACGAHVIVVNPEPTSHAGGDAIFVQADAAQALPLLLHAE